MLRLTRVDFSYSSGWCILSRTPQNTTPVERMGLIRGRTRIQQRSDEQTGRRADEMIRQVLCWREIERHLDGVETILVVGGEIEAYSIPLAHRGYEVTHVAASSDVGGRVQRDAGEPDNLHRVTTEASDLFQFGNRSFDLVLNLDGAISFCGPQAEQCLRESCRVAGGTLIVTVSNRAQVVSVATSESLAESGEIGSPVYVIFDRGEWYNGTPDDCSVRANGYQGPMKAFLAAELQAILEDADLKILRVGGLGSLVNMCSQKAVDRACEQVKVLEEFVTLCERFDLEILPDGPGTSTGPGLIGVARRE